MGGFLFFWFLFGFAGTAWGMECNLLVSLVFDDELVRMLYDYKR